MRTYLLLFAAAVLGFGTVTTAIDSGPDIAFAENVPEDLRALATETWHDFVELHPARTECLTPPVLAAAWELDARAKYWPGSSLIVVRVPGTVATLSNAMVHEYAHHLEFTCGIHSDLRSAFLKAQGFHADTPWLEGDSWQSTPSEHYAEATVQLVLGSRHHRGNIRISEGAVEVVRRWASGS